MKTKSLWLAVTALTCLTAAVNSSPAQSWILTSAPTNSWAAVASSADGTKLVAVPWRLPTGHVIYTPLYTPTLYTYTSTNSGADWTANSNTTSSWVSVASSADGNRLVAVASLGAVYASPDSGGTWSNVLNLNITPNGFGCSVASSTDGTKLAALIAPSCIFTSTNSGLTWISNHAAAFSSSSASFSSIASSADGTKLAVTFTGGNVCTSTNSGTTWKSNNLPALDWNGIACSADGNKLVLVTGWYGDPTPIYLSTNGGTTWQMSSAPTNLNTSWKTAAMSADGSKIVAVTGWAAAQSGPIYTSLDSGLTWVSNSAPIASWASVASSADGGKFVAAVDGGGIYTSQSSPASQLNIAPSGGEIALSWIVPSVNFALRQNSDLTTTNWTDVDIPSTLNLTNLQYQVTVPSAAGQQFYRIEAR